MRVPIQVRRLPHAEGLPLPHYKHPGDSGMDVAAAIQDSRTIHPGQLMLVPTGFCFAVPPGYEIQVRSKSGKVTKKRLVVANQPGTVDAGYRGEVLVAIENAGANAASIERGEEIAQLVVAPVMRGELTEVQELDDTSRGDGGFGSTEVPRWFAFTIFVLSVVGPIGAAALLAFVVLV